MRGYAVLPLLNDPESSQPPASTKCARFCICPHPLAAVCREPRHSRRPCEVELPQGCFLAKAKSKAKKPAPRRPAPRRPAPRRARRRRSHQEGRAAFDQHHPLPPPPRPPQSDRRRRRPTGTTHRPQTTTPTSTTPTTTPPTRPPAPLRPRLHLEPRIASLGTIFFSGTSISSWWMNQSAIPTRVQLVPDPAGIPGMAQQFTT